MPNIPVLESHPTTFMFFFLKVEEKIRIVFQETLFGPEQIDPEVDFSADFPEGDRPNLHKELKYFTKFGDATLTIDMLLSFTHFNRQGGSQGQRPPFSCCDSADFLRPVRSGIPCRRGVH
jgi:hypothetical protein